MKKNILIGQSGGPTAVINSSLYGCIIAAQDNHDKIDKILGMKNGIEGYIDGKIINIEKDVSQQKIESLLYTPGAFLGSCRFKLPEDLNNPIYYNIFRRFNSDNIGYFIYIGGNDSMDTVNKLNTYARKINSQIKFIGIPKSIDNDLLFTDHTPGFASAAKFVATAVHEITLDASVYNIKSVTIIELMGRNAGWITASSILARSEKGSAPHLIYLPETVFNIDTFIKQISEKLKEINNVIVCVSEGIKDKDNKFICEYNSDNGTDIFGHKTLTGCGKYLEEVVKEKIGVKVRSIELNVLQRCSANNISKKDSDEAIKSGYYGVNQALIGNTGKMVCIERKSSENYDVDYTLQDVNLICNKEKLFPREWILNDKADISDEYLHYVEPLIS